MVHKEMEMQYIEEEKLRVNGLMRRLDSIPALKTHSTGVNPAHRHLRKHPIKTILSNWHTGGTSRSNRSVRDTGSVTDLWSRQLEMDSSRSSLSITDDLHLMSEVIQPSSMFLTHEISREAMQVSSTIEVSNMVYLYIIRLKPSTCCCTFCCGSIAFLQENFEWIQIVHH